MPAVLMQLVGIDLAHLLSLNLRLPQGGAFIHRSFNVHDNPRNRFTYETVSLLKPHRNPISQKSLATLCVGHRYAGSTW